MRYTDAAFTTFAGLDPAGNERGPHHLDQRRMAADAVPTDIARIVAMPRRSGVSAGTTRQGRQAGAGQAGRSRGGVLGLALSAAVAVAATLLWVSPSAGAPSRQANTPPIGVEHAVAGTLPLR